MKEIDHLKVHIIRGCLSDIPPSFGTSKNENLHRSLNARFSGNKLGVEVAVAILATFFHLWNSKHNGSDILSSIAGYLDYQCKEPKENLQLAADSSANLELVFLQSDLLYLIL